MATIGALQSSWSNMGQKLGTKCSGTTGAVGATCTGLLLRHAQISGRVGDWNGLPANSATFDPVVAALDDAKQKLSAASGGAMAPALASAGSAMNQVEALLDG